MPQREKNPLTAEASGVRDALPIALHAPVWPAHLCDTEALPGRWSGTSVHSCLNGEGTVRGGLEQRAGPPRLSLVTSAPSSHVSTLGRLRMQKVPAVE